MNDVKLPITTKREGDKITKVCVEDIYKILNRIQNAIVKAHDNSIDIINSVNKEVFNEKDNTTYKGELIVGTGVSQPCLNDIFDEEIGNNIAFMKAKLNANIKKHNILCRVYNELFAAIEVIDNDLYKVDDFIRNDLYLLRAYNNDYLKGIEVKLGI